MTAPPQPAPAPPRSVLVIGAGAAGLAAACALAQAGHHVEILERRPYVGGRASSYLHPAANEIIDNCQHILLGCCTNLIHFLRQIGAADHIRWFDRITFLSPGGHPSLLAPTPLPAPFHTAPSFLTASAFSLRDKLAIARAMLAFLPPVPADTATESFAAWLARHGQTPRAIRRFWKPVLASALNEDPDRISLFYAAKVFREAFLYSPGAGRMGIPDIPLADLYAHALPYLESRGARLHLRASADHFSWDPARAQWTVTTPAASHTADALILALSFEATAKLLPALPANPAAHALAAQLAAFDHSPITSLHLWFDREITHLPHAVLLDSSVDWMYHPSRLQPARHPSPDSAHPPSYLELVSSASRWTLPLSPRQILDRVLPELPRYFPRAAHATLLKSVVVKEVRATYSVRPQLDSLRPTPRSPWPNLFLAGDWTATGWPATMEGAVRSGYLAAQALTGTPFLVPDLPPTGLMRLFA
jgi:squalene-associated FAD-dependent desaturase